MAKRARSTPIRWKRVFATLDLKPPSDVTLVVEAIIETAVSLGGVAEPPTDEQVRVIVNEVVRVENWNSDKHPDATNQGHHRVARYSSGPQRLRLHADIIESLYTKVRPDDDEHITIERGGALPKSGVRQENIAVFVIGPPASGKSRVARVLAESTHAITIDSDDAKRMLPEYRNGLNATALHRESSEIIKGNNGLYREALRSGMNVVVPTVGESIKELRDLLAEQVLPGSPLRGYRMYLVHVQCPVEIAAFRSLLRLRDTGRYVPLEKLLVEIGGRVQRAYGKMKQEQWAGYAAFSTRADGKEPEVIENRGCAWFVQEKGSR
jgi:predicted kinase